MAAVVLNDSLARVLRSRLWAGASLGGVTRIPSPPKARVAGEHDARRVGRCRAEGALSPREHAPGWGRAVAG